MSRTLPHIGSGCGFESDEKASTVLRDHRFLLEACGQAREGHGYPRLSSLDGAEGYGNSQMVKGLKIDADAASGTDWLLPSIHLQGVARILAFS